MKAQQWLEILANLFFWVLLTWVVIRMFSLQTYEIEVINGVETVRASRDRVFERLLWTGQLFKVLFFYLNFDLIRRLSGAQGVKKKGWQALALLFFFLGLEWSLARWFFLPVLAPFPWLLSLGLYFFSLAISTAYALVKMSFRQEAARKALELDKKQVELHLLRSQLQPHFLFNTLNNLLSMVDQEQNPQLAESFERLSGLLRYVVYETAREQVPLARELQFIRDYAELAMIRYAPGEVDFRLEQRGEFDQQPIEPGILSPFVENAFKHGVQPEERSFIHIRVDVSADRALEFTIRNSIHFLPERGKPAGWLGLQSTRERLNLLYPGRHGLETREENQTYTVHLQIQTV